MHRIERGHLHDAYVVKKAVVLFGWEIHAIQMPEQHVVIEPVGACRASAPLRIQTAEKLEGLLVFRIDVDRPLIEVIGCEAKERCGLGVDLQIQRARQRNQFFRRIPANSSR